MIEAKEILCSENPQGDRLMTMWCRYPKFVHCEHLRHRSFSFSVSSSRAISVAKNLKEVRSDELRAAPIWWGCEQRGMQSGDEIPYTHLSAAKGVWNNAAIKAADLAEWLVEAEVHKSIVNRLLEPFLHVNVLVTGTTAGWMNFFGLRLDRAAQPEIRALAEAQWKVWNESKPQKLGLGQWHLPFIEERDYEIEQDSVIESIDNLLKAYWPGSDGITPIIKISVARCARLSYTSFGTGRRSAIEEDLRLYDRLIGAIPIHASPAEHQATSDEQWEGGYAMGTVWVPKEGWKHPEQSGNLGPGWRQYRKMLAGEAVAPLPADYRE